MATLVHVLKLALNKVYFTLNKRSFYATFTSIKGHRYRPGQIKYFFPVLFDLYGCDTKHDNITLTKQEIGFIDPSLVTTRWYRPLINTEDN